MNSVSDTYVISVKYAEEDFQQVLKFSYQKEGILPSGTKSLYSFSRRVQISYVGLREGIHKFQLGVLRSELSLSGMANNTAELSKSLHRALGLLVLGADLQGNLVKIYNFPYVKHRWNELKNEFLQEYEKEKYLVLIHEMDQHIATEHALLAYLQLPTMYGLYFNGCWQMHSNNDAVMKTVVHGMELSERRVEESHAVDVKRNETQLQVRIHTGFNKNTYETTDIRNYTGISIYVDGVLDTCKKEIQLDSTKFYYSAKWVGLKKLFQ